MKFTNNTIGIGGEGGIRTLGRFDPTPDFESGTFDHSATSPNRWAIIATARKAITHSDVYIKL
jgi:hypothetical protein